VPDVHLDPDALLAVAASAEALVPALRPPALDPADLAELAGLPGGAALVAEHDRLCAAMVRAARELGELAAALGAVAAATEAADRCAARALTGAG
jgi:hypothetical protein